MDAVTIDQIVFAFKVITAIALVLPMRDVSKRYGWGMATLLYGIFVLAWIR